MGNLVLVKGGLEVAPSVPKPKSRNSVGKHKERRPREWLTQQEIDLLLAAVPSGRLQERNRLIILLGFRHGLRATEICNLRWDDVDLSHARITIRRIKRGDDSRQPLTPKEMRALRSWQRHQPVESPFIITGWSAAPIHRATIWDVITKVGRKANLGFSIHPHMLRHSNGYHLGSTGVDIRTIQALLGHRNISHTVHYVAMNEDRFKGLFKD